MTTISSINKGDILVVNSRYIIKVREIDNRESNTFIQGIAFVLDTNGIPAQKHPFEYLHTSPSQIAHATAEQTMHYELVMSGKSPRIKAHYEPRYQAQYFAVTFNGTLFIPQAFIRTTTEPKPHYTRAFSTIELCEACCNQLNNTLSQATKN